jgi:hypothetical protein
MSPVSLPLDSWKKKKLEKTNERVCVCVLTRIFYADLITFKYIRRFLRSPDIKFYFHTRQLFTLPFLEAGWYLTDGNGQSFSFDIGESFSMRFF